MAARRTFDDEADADVDETPVRTYWQLARRRFLRNRLAVAGLVVLSLLVVASIVIPALTGDAWRTAVLAKVNRTRPVSVLVRRGEVVRTPGFDGEYGSIRPAEIASSRPSR